MCTYNVFRRRGHRVYCAVPEDCVVPHFLDGKTWVFDGKIEDTSAPPIGFNDQAAAVGVRYNGFYLFHAFAAW